MRERDGGGGGGEGVVGIHTFLIMLHTNTQYVAALIMNKLWRAGVCERENSIEGLWISFVPC